MNKYKKSLWLLADELDLIGIAGEVLGNPRFEIWPGAGRPGQHHHRIGGLAEHVCEVVDLCLMNNAMMTEEKKVDRKKLYLSALFHDVGKMWDYEPVDDNYSDWRDSKHKTHIHHISRSAVEWNKAKIIHGFEDDEDEVLHAI